MQVKKIDKDDVHDFLGEYRQNNQQSLEKFLFEIAQQQPFGDNKFYVFSFLKHNMRGHNEKTLFHQPRLTKPEPTDSSMCFRLNPKRLGEVEVIWILPNLEAINLFKKGKLFENEIVNDSIRDYVKNPEKLKRREPDDLPDFLIKGIYKDKVMEAKRASNNQFLIP
jgi:hypothetical protein